MSISISTSSLAFPLLVVIVVLLLSERRDDDTLDNERDTQSTDADADAAAEDPPITARLVAITGARTPNSPGATEEAEERL